MTFFQAVLVAAGLMAIIGAFVGGVLLALDGWDDGEPRMLALGLGLILAALSVSIWIIDHATEAS